MMLLRSADAVLTWTDQGSGSAEDLVDVAFNAGKPPERAARIIVEHPHDFAGPDQSAHHKSRLGVEPRHRFIEKYHIRVIDQRLG